MISYAGSEFEMTWRGLKGNLDLQATYLASISPSAFQTLFKLSLPPAVLSSVLTTILQRMLTVQPSQCSTPSEARQHCLALMDALRAAPRFDMTLMCLPSKDRKALGALWPSSESVQRMGLDEGQQKHLESLQQAFRL